MWVISLFGNFLLLKRSRSSWISLGYILALLFTYYLTVLFKPFNCQEFLFALLGNMQNRHLYLSGLLWIMSVDAVHQLPDNVLTILLGSLASASYLLLPHFWKWTKLVHSKMMSTTTLHISSRKRWRLVVSPKCCSHKVKQRWWKSLRFGIKQWGKKRGSKLQSSPAVWLWRFTSCSEPQCPHW